MGSFSSKRLSSFNSYVFITIAFLILFSQVEKANAESKEDWVVLVICAEHPPRGIWPNKKWGWTCSASEPAVGFESSHTIWDKRGGVASAVARNLVERDARNRLSNKYNLNFVSTAQERISKWGWIEDKIKKEL